jgi:hypothetical protein
MCLIDGLADIFSPSAVSKMSDEQLENIAGESPLVTTQRAQLTEKKARLQSALWECLVNGEEPYEI